MTQKLLCSCAVVALLVAFSTANVASAQEVAVPEPSAPVATCPCEFGPAVATCRIGCYRAAWYAPGCPPAVTYRVGLFGHIRPVVHAPVVHAPVVRVPVARIPVVRAPVCYPTPVCYPAPVVCRPAYVPRLPVVYPCATPYVVPRVKYTPYCW